MTITLGASILSSDLSNIEQQVNLMINSGIDYIHWDLCDGHFVPNITFGYPIIKSSRAKTNFYFCVHLMVTNPELWLERLFECSVDRIIFHVEIPDQTSIGLTLSKIKKQYVETGLALNTDSNVEILFKYLDTGLVDCVLILGVNAGFSGQKFNLETIQKVKTIKNKYPLVKIIVDGGVNLSNCQDIIKAGADSLVSGSALFESDNIENTINMLKCEKIESI